LVKLGKLHPRNRSSDLEMLYARGVLLTSRSYLGGQYHR
jgi:hypothetical protein